MKKKLDSNIKSALDSIYFDYKKYKIIDSSQYLKWKKCSYEFKTNPLYFNKNHEIHARLNEILSGNIPYNHMILDQYYLPHFPLIKDDLIEFNQYLLKNFKNI